MTAEDRALRVLLVLDTPTEADQPTHAMRQQVVAAARLAQASADANDATGTIALTVCGLVMVDGGESLSQGALAAQNLRGVLDRLVRSVSQDPSLPLDIRPIVRVCSTTQAVREVADVVADNRIDLLLVDWRWGWHVLSDGSTIMDAVLQKPLCDVAVLGPGIDLMQAKNVLLAVRGGPYAALALKMARALVEQNAGQVTLLHVVAPDADAGQQQLEEAFYGDFVRHNSARAERVHQKLVVSDDPLDAILAESHNHDLIVLGATAISVREDDEIDVSDPTRLPAVFGALGGTIAERLYNSGRSVSSGLIIVRARAPQDFYFAQVPHRQRMRQRLMTDPAYISHVVDKWFAENTFDANEFDDIERLIALKKAQGVTISLGLPALNEEATVGEVITKLKEALFDRYPLLDEIVLIDSDSTDSTVQIACELGVPVHVHQRTLPSQGARRGKGEALWKSLYVLKGDIVAWVDTDVKNMDARFVYGLIGPLLVAPHLQYVKGYYRRPIQIGDSIYQTGGGRVTELTVRPLFNLFYPELSGLIQPLAGEYAGRRACLEQLPFFTGYGVETGHLIDVLERFGLGALGQVNLQERVHRNQELTALSQMAFAITQVIFSRLGQRDDLAFATDINRNMKLIRHDEGGLNLEVRRIEETERPPMIDVPEYRQMHRQRLST